MDKALVKLRYDVPLKIFNVPIIRQKAKEVFESLGTQKAIKEREDEMLAVINLGYTEDFSYENVVEKFKPHFYKEILQQALEMAITQSNRFNIVSNILTLLPSEYTMKKAINGNAFYCAMEDVIKELPISIHEKSQKIILLQKSFYNSSE